MTKRVISIILAITMVLSLCCTVSFANGVAVTAGYDTNGRIEVDGGESFKVPVAVTGLDKGIIGYDISLVYDDKVLEPIVTSNSAIDWISMYGMKFADSELGLSTVLDNPAATYENDPAVSVSGMAGENVTPENGAKKAFVANFKVKDGVTKRESTRIGVVANIKYYDNTNGVVSYTNVTTSGVSVVINKDVVTPVEITLSDLEVAYDGTVKAPGVSLSDWTNYTITYNGQEGAPTNAGTYDVVLTITEEGFSGTKNATFVIKPAEVNVTANSDEKYVGQVDPAFTYDYTGTLYGTDAFTGELAREAGEEAGTYAIKQGTLSLGANYKINFTEGVFTVKDKKTQNVTEVYPVETSKRYGDAGFRWEFALDSVSGCTETSYASTNEDVATIDASGNVTIVGAGTTELTFTVAGNGEYKDFVRTSTFEVGKKDLAIVIDDKTEILGNGAATLTYQALAADALAYEDTISVVLEREAGNEIDVAYEISASSIVIINKAGADVTDNYNITVDNGEYKIITKLLQAVEVGTIASEKTYGDNDFTFDIVDSEAVITGAITVTSSNENVATVSYANGTVTVDVKNAGSTDIRVYRAGNEEYADLDVKQTVVVNKRPLKLAVIDQFVKVGRELPSLVGQWTFVEGELYGSDDVTGELAYETGANTTVVGETFDILQGTLTAGDNYALEVVAGTLTIIDKTPQNLVVEDIAAKTYGDGAFALAVTNDSGLSAYTYSVSGSQTEQTATSVATVDASGNVTITGAGTAYITVTEPGNDEYAAKSVTKEIVVNKAALTITVTVVDKVYGQAYETPVVAYTGFVNSENESVLTTAPSVSGMPEAKADAGDYAISVSGAETDNYEITYVNDTFTISPRPIYIVGIDVFDKEYDGTTAATVNPDSIIIYTTTETDGIVTGDVVMVRVKNAGTSTFADAEVGVDKTVTVVGADFEIEYSSVNSANYTLVVSDSYITDATIYAAGTMTAQNVADQLPTSIVLTPDDETLPLPIIPDGFSIAIKTSDNESVIALDGTVNGADVDTVVNVTFEVVSNTDATDIGTSAPVAVSVPKLSKKTVTVVDDGKGTLVGNIGAQPIGTLIELTAVPNSGYKVSAWSIDGVSVGNIGTSYSFILEDDITVGISFVAAGGYRPSTGGGGGGSTVASYTVKYDSNGGSSVASEVVKEGDTAAEPKAPTKEGYKFAGWYSDKELTNAFDFATKITASKTLFAKWVVDNSKNELVLKIGDKKATAFGEEKENDVAPIIVNDRTMLPARFVAEALGATVEWDEATSKVTIKNGDLVIELTIDSDIAYINGEEVKLDSPAFLQNSRTYTPIRFVAEALGASVEWIEAEEKVVITVAK